MPKRDEITVGCKVNKEIAQKLRDRASQQGVGVNTLLKEMINGSLNSEVEDMLLAISFLYDVDVQDLVVGVKELLDNGELIIKERHVTLRNVT